MANMGPQTSSDGKVWTGGKWVDSTVAPTSTATPSWSAGPGQPGAGQPASSWAPSAPAGIQPGAAQEHLSSLNNSDPTDTKQFFDTNQSVWTNPSGGEVNNWGLIGEFSDPNNRVQGTNNSQDWFGRFSGSMPSISAEPGFGAYFDNAKNRAAESINQAMAARGAYGSSAANDQTSRAFTDLDAQRALKEADYNLQRLAEQRAWEGLGGQLAGAADSQGNNLVGQEQSWVDLLSRMGIDASRLGLDRTNAGADAARAATADERTRGQDYFANQLALGDRLMEIYRTVMLPALENDGVLMSDASSGGVAQGNAALANEQANTKQMFDALAAGYGIATDPNAPWK